MIANRILIVFAALGIGVVVVLIDRVFSDRLDRWVSASRERGMVAIGVALASIILLVFLVDLVPALSFIPRELRIPAPIPSMIPGPELDTVITALLYVAILSAAATFQRTLLGVRWRWHSRSQYRGGEARWSHMRISDLTGSTGLFLVVAGTLALAHLRNPLVVISVSLVISFHFVAVVMAPVFSRAPWKDGPPTRQRLWRWIGRLDQLLAVLLVFMLLTM